MRAALRRVVIAAALLPPGVAAIVLSPAACRRDAVAESAGEVALGGRAVQPPADEGASPVAVEADPLAPAAPDLSGGWLDGVWIGGGRDRYHLVITVDGATASVVGLDGTEHWAGAFTVEALEGGSHRLRDAAGAFALHVFTRGDNEVLGVLFGENGLAEARRVHPTPPALLGAWVVGFSDNYHLAGGSATFAPDSWSVRVGDHFVRTGAIRALGARDGALQVALQTSPRYLELANFVRTPGDTWLAWIQGTDQHMVFHRDGARPAWVPDGDRRVRIAGTD